MRFFITGGAGFIGSTLCDALLAAGHEVRVFDDLSTGRDFFLEGAKKNSRFSFFLGDIRELEAVGAALQGYAPDWVVHFAANADVRKGTDRPRRDLDYNTIGTWNVLEATRLAGCKRIVFSSTGSVYGEPEVFPTPENAPFPEQTSLYGASKLAGEGLISAYAHGFGFTGIVFRFVSILGPRYTHGHVFDFVRHLRKDPNELPVLGDGNQNKSYLHIDDLMAGLTLVMNRFHDKSGFHVFNIGHDDSLTVNRSIDTITERMGIKPARKYSGGTRGWIGDSPRIQLDTAKLKALGWAPKHSLRDSVIATVDYLQQHAFLLEQ